MAKAKTVTKKAAPKKSSAKPASAIAVNSVTPFLWFEKDAEKAARFYCSLIKGSKVTSANPMSVTFQLGGQRFNALNGGPHYALTPAFSIFVSVNTQAEVDDLWSRLTADGGQESMCGWLIDKFGVSWQIIPKRLDQLLSHKDPKVAVRAMDAMLKMQKIDISALDAAARAKK